MKKIAHSLAALNSTLEPLPGNSGTTGMTCQDPRGSNLTGVERGGTCAATLAERLEAAIRKDPRGPLAINTALRRSLKPLGMSWRELSEPLTAAEILDQLKVLRALTTRRAEDVEEMEILLVAYGQRLSEYPADIVRHVLTEQPRKSKWFPAWFELAEELDDWNNERQRLMKEKLK